jgi:VIT1/CCC1 family predicted Fe2+/Mn2+ transporter
MIKILKNQEYIRSILFGFEDSLISTTGLIAGTSIGSDNNKFVMLAVIVAISIEAVAMGAGEYLSDDFVKDIDKLKRNRDNPLLSGVLMLLSYLFAGMIPLLPTLFFVFPLSLILSILFAFIAFFLLGYIKGRLLDVSPLKSGLRILIVGGLATALGLLLGFVFKIK